MCDGAGAVEGVGEGGDLYEVHGKLDRGQVGVGASCGVSCCGEKVFNGEGVASESAPGGDSVTGDLVVVGGFLADREGLRDLFEEAASVAVGVVLGVVEIEQVKALAT
ncbi:hypothetical protein GCM10010411_63780 [Actinomadura fulvescens]|uniref:Uncharacterized protein n=1 Tax=Actinomadura fulvescens TaxID=46160 RepID=A0ABP6CJP0_9ACTN